MRILHLTTDNKFLNYALQTFENVYPGKNDVLMLKYGAETHTINNMYEKISHADLLNPFLANKFKKYDFVVVHSLQFFWMPLILLSPKNVKFAWLGWGFDYYDLIYKSQSEMFLGFTQKAEKKIKYKNFSIKNIFIDIVRFSFKFPILSLLRPFVLKRVTSFSPVLLEDYKLIENARLTNYVPPYISWNYGSLEDSLVKGFIGDRVTGDNILIGNSAFYANNHLEIFEVLKNCDLQLRKVIAPLSYGDVNYCDYIIDRGRTSLGNSFQPLTDFMAISDYIQLVKSCGFVIMNHIRQQALGNIVLMLYLGAKVFLREESPAYQFFKQEGATVYTVQELESDKSMLNSPLDQDEVSQNIKVLKKHWSRKAIDKKTRGLVEFLINSKD